MVTRRMLAIVSFAAMVAAAGAALAQPVKKLTPQDYIDIEQLTNAYPDKIDHCTNSGYDYADQYAPDAVFGVSSEWGGKGKVWYRGRDQLADAGGGGKGGCRPRSANLAQLHHIATSLVITPTATGAKGRSTLLSLNGGGDGAPPKIEWQGGYEDTYVKTAKGWRFKSRFHVWPGFDWADTAAEQYARSAAQRAAKP